LSRIDYRIYAPETDGKTKNDPLREMLLHAVGDKGVHAQTILFDRWYASVDNLKLVQRLGLRFVTTLKANRLVSLTPEAGYVPLDALVWTEDQMQHGLSVQLQELPLRVPLFKVVAPDGHLDWAITNGSDPTVTPQVVQAHSDVRWQGEQLHRGLKQLTGTQRGQCRSARSQRTHLACCYQAWLSRKMFATQVGKTLYQVREELFDDYLRAEVRHPRIPVFLGG
jgi:hypothetical protein